jgi:hypothetical protein
MAEVKLNVAALHEHFSISGAPVTDPRWELIKGEERIYW